MTLALVLVFADRPAAQGAPDFAEPATDVTSSPFRTEVVNVGPDKADASSVGLWVGGRGDSTLEKVNPYPVDRAGNTYDAGTLLSGQLRLGLSFVGGFHFFWKRPATVSFDLEASGHAGTGQGDLEGRNLPNAGQSRLRARRAFARLSLDDYFNLGFGLTTHDWGMGLIYNGGDRVWEPGSAQFVDPRRGDIVVRGSVGTGPHTGARIRVSLFQDQIWQGDRIASGDEADQFGLALTLGDRGEGASAGLQFVRRRLVADDEDSLRIRTIDATGEVPFDVGIGTLTWSNEVAYMFGTSEVDPSLRPEDEVQDVSAWAAATRIHFARSNYGLVLDGLFAQGDKDFFDGEVNIFFVNRNFEMGLMLFRHVLAAHSGRSTFTAATDPSLGDGHDLTRFPSRGGIGNAWVFFPKVFYQPTDGFEVYGGPMLAWSHVDLADPVNSANDDPRNALGGDPSRFLGTEVDIGVRGRVRWFGVEYTAGFEGGVLFPGSALRDDDFEKPPPVVGSRATLQARF